jgi:NADH:ubiquinone oxidoreductase subunit|tara:strand:- start:369 stop:725 length:357 start_codon:yes stop_codon:yes gene_type:complete
MIKLKQIFTWWNKQTFGTFLLTIFSGKLAGKDQYGNKYYRSKQDKRWVIYAKDIEATKITNDWYLWMHHTVDEIPNLKNKKYLWEKEHSENLTGSSKSYKPSKIQKKDNLKKYETWKI